MKKIKNCLRTISSNIICLIQNQGIQSRGLDSLTIDTLPEILLIDKPKGITSYDVIRILKNKLEIHNKRGQPRVKIGHAGTLDPLASGLMIIGLKNGTKKLNEYLKLPKTYIAEVLIGESRTTGDMEGEIIDSVEKVDLSEERISRTVLGMTGGLQLPVPSYSAIKQNGTALYKKARRGEKVETPIKKMVIRDTKLLGIEKTTDRVIATIEFDVESGVYIRSVAEELGRRLGYPATIKELRRTRIGDFLIKDAEKMK